MQALEILTEAILHRYRGRIALVSSFGAEAAILLHMVARIQRSTPVLFLDTGKLFGETHRYREALTRQLGLSDVRVYAPGPRLVERDDPDGLLCQRNADACCALRKVEPLKRALNGFDAWINGRKRYHGAARATLPLIEPVDGRIKINPLADWESARIDAYFTEHQLPRHPLYEDGYRSIGCMPCTDRAVDGAAPRSGRWQGLGKNECGIHLPFPPIPVREKE